MSDAKASATISAAEKEAIRARIAAQRDERTEQKQEKVRDEPKAPLTEEQQRIAQLIEVQRDKERRGELSDVHVTADYSQHPAVALFDLPDWIKKNEIDREYGFFWVLAEDVESRFDHPYFGYRFVNASAPFARKIPKTAFDHSGGIVRRFSGDTFVMMYVDRQHYDRLMAAPGEMSRARMSSAKEQAKASGFYESESGPSESAVEDGAFRPLPVGEPVAVESIISE